MKRSAAGGEGRVWRLALCLSLGMPALASAQAPDELEMVRDQWIFVFADGLPAGAVAAQADRAVAAVGGRRGHVYTHALRGFSARMPAAAAARLAALHPQVAYYEADQVARIVARPPGGGGGGGSQPAEVLPWGIARVEGGLGASSGTAWVIDTGVDQDHPDLHVDQARSANFVSRGKYKVDDGNGHGTHVAGSIAAIDNSIGVIGVVPGARVVGVRVLGDNGSGSYADVIAGIDYVAAHGVAGDVANMSLGGGYSQAVNDAVVAASALVKFALAAGNEATDAAFRSPASAEGPNIYTVAAFGQGDVWAGFSNYGKPPIDCAAPGVGVYSTYKDGGYATLSGTSMATPHVAGALLLGTPAQDGTVQDGTVGDSYPVCITP